MKILEQNTDKMVKEQKNSNKHLRSLINKLSAGGGKSEDQGKQKKERDLARDKLGRFAGKNDSSSMLSGVVDLLKKTSKTVGSMMNNLNTRFIVPMYKVIHDLGKTITQHIVDGFKGVGSYFKTHLDAILAPVEDVVKPVMAIVTNLFSFGKKLFLPVLSIFFTPLLKIIKSIWKDLKKSYELQRRKGDIKGDKKSGMFTQLAGPIVALLIGLFTGIAESFEIFIKPFKSKIGKIFIKAVNYIINPLKNVFGKILSFKPIRKIIDFFGKISKFAKSSKFAGIFGGIGRVLGKLLIPFFMIKRAVEEWGNADNLRDKILGAAAGILEVFLEFPQWVLNKILGLFSDFQVDFSADAIIGAVNSATQWVSDNITQWIFDMVQGFPDIFAGMKEFFTDFGQKVLSMFKGTGDFFNMIKNYIIDIIYGLTKDIPVVGRYAKDLLSLKTAEIEPEAKQEKNIANLNTGSAVEAAKAEAMKEQVRYNREVSGKLDETNRGIQETNNLNKNIINNQQNIQVTEKRDDIPSDPENFAILMMNKNHGM